MSEACFSISWGVLFSHPRDFTPVCTTELGRAAQLSPEFIKRNVKLMALSVDSLEEHHGWSKDIMAYNNAEPGSQFPFPIIADDRRELVERLGMLDPEEKDRSGMPLTARCVFVIGPDKKLKLSILYPATTGRNFDEILRVIDSLQLTAHNRVATPVDWRVRTSVWRLMRAVLILLSVCNVCGSALKPGNSVMVPPSIPETEAAALFPAGVYTKDLPSGKKYLRYTPQPNTQQQ
ncbi:peroxiredoxin-6-like isoform X2 [Onychostoma macrolepis]|uniref:peroxiredoxin-6-like isoform X2 n=1 Tax=Onychostoma macrolepis TaxID=369639 RepID=UPI00272A078C|nr:peroxiredoxin-6-like isoform X2 [Onychostoma macrolepis]